MRTQRGAASLELVILIPALLMLLGVAVFGGRLAQVRSALTDTAQRAARAGSLESTPAQARSRAQALVQTDLEGVPCRDPQAVVVAPASRPGQPSRMEVTVTCTIDLSDLLVPGLPGSWAESARESAVVDTWRRR